MSEHRPPGCENCKKTCSIHLTQIINGQVKKLDMCDSCPKSKQMHDPMEFGLMEQLLGMTMQPGTAGLPLPVSQGAVCGACGYTESQFRKTGRLGCPHCYDVFIMPRTEILSKLHDSIVHKGKVPQNSHKVVSRQELARLKDQLKSLVLEEDYEQAAIIRDKIKKITAELKKSSHVKDR